MSENRSLSLLKITLAVVVMMILSFTIASNLQVNAADNIEREELRTFLDGVLRQQLAAERISGAVISVVADDQVIYEQGIGNACWQNEEKMDPGRHLVRTGSIGKVFTWTAILQQVDRGELELDEDVNNYLPEELQLEYDNNQAPVTLTELMTHTAGFEDRSITLLASNQENLLSLEEYMNQYGHPELVYKPGEVPAYSNYGTTLAGYIIEEVSGKSYEDYIESEIFSPLWMQNSTVAQPPEANLRENMSCGHEKSAGRYIAREFEYINELPAGGHSTTARDISFFMRAIMPQMNGEDSSRIWNILPESKIEKLFTPYFSPHPQASGWTLGLKHQKLAGEEIFWHGGDTNLFSTGMFFLPERDMGIFVAYNGGEGTFARKELLRALITEFFPGDLKAGAGEIEQELSEFTGRYYSSRSSHSTPEKLLSRLKPLNISAGDEELIASAHRKISYLPGEREDEFISQQGKHSLIFTRDDNGEISGVIRGENPTQKYFKLSLLESPLLHLAVVITAFFTYLLTLVVNIRGLFRGIKRSFTRQEYLPVWPGVLLSGLGIIFILVQSYFFYDLIQHPYGWPEWMGLVNLIPVLMIILLLIDIYLIIKKGLLQSNFINQLFLILISLSFLSVLYHYNFIGFLVFNT